MAPVTRGLRDLVADAARAIGRPAGDGQPFAQILADNWFDSAQSLAGSRPEELVALGIPLRFAQQIVTVASKAAGGSRAGSGGGGGQPPRGSAGGGASRRDGRPPAPQQAPQGRGGPPSGGGGSGRVKVIRLKEMDAGFRSRGHLLGPKGKNVHHIQDATGVRVELRGHGDRITEMAFADAPDGRALDQAVKMGKDLLRAVYNQYDEWSRDGGRQGGGGGSGPRVGGGKGSGSGKERGGKSGGGKGGKQGREKGPTEPAECVLQHAIDVQEMDPDFHLKARLIGRKGSNMKELESRIGAGFKVHVQGGEPGEPCRLELGAADEDQMNQAIDLAEQLLSRIYEEYDRWLETGGKDPEPEGGEGAAEGDRKRKRGDDKMEFADTLEVDIPDCDPRFSIRGKLLGKGGGRLNDIQRSAGGARIDMLGTDGPGPFTLNISAPTAECLDSAVRMCEDMIQEIHEQYAKFLEENDAPPDEGNDEAGEGGKGKGRRKGGAVGAVSSGGGKGRDREKGKGSGGGKGGGVKRILKLKDCDPEFKLGARIRGNKCENLHHIQDETGAQLWVLGEPGEPVRLEITADQPGKLEEAARMAKDLIRTIFHEYEGWRGRNGPPPAKRQRA